ncbi:MAG: DUF2182 domain-containing protein [Acidobacteriota bacterium]|nr:MAG: DUF2182 domain-containing protein [Acidobacteriota bacterium]
METVFSRDRTIVLAGIGALTALSWFYTIQMSLDVSHMAMGHHGHAHEGFFYTFIMWSIMMVAMMTPTATPMVLTFARINRKRRNRGQPYVATSVFLAGYLVVWVLFSAVAAFAQLELQEIALVNAMLASSSPIFSGILLLTAGVFQWTPLKQACLKHCRTPLSFILTDWKEGTTGAFQMGLKHGVFCTVCCWFLMALLFVLGVMNILWMALITGITLVEKVVPWGDKFSRVAGVVLGLWGLLILAGI